MKARIVAIAGLVVALLAPPAGADPEAAADPPVSACGPGVDELGDYTPVLDLELPEQVNWAGTRPPYGYDATAGLDAFDRVGYCLELTGPGGTSWVWTSMEATTADPADLGLPTLPGQVTRRWVDDLTVRSSAAGVAPADAATGWLEMWPYSTVRVASHQVPGANGDDYDADDTPSTTGPGYGTFQVHVVDDTEPPVTALSVNAFTAPASPLRRVSVGIGNAPTGEIDWTLAGNAPDYTTRRLTTYVRPAVVELTQAPSSRQLSPRDGTDTSVTVPIAGQVTDPAVTGLELTVHDGASATTTPVPIASGGGFSTSVTVPVGLTARDIELTALRPGGDRRVLRAVDLVAGDVFVIHGQSNAQATMYDGSSHGARSPWIRSFGTTEAHVQLSVADRTWHYASGDRSLQPGAVGQWGLQLARRIVDTYGIPVAVINGSRGGQPIGYFQRDDADPADPETNYGRLYQRLDAAGLADGIDAVLWYQGEHDLNDAATHVSGFTSLLTDLRADYGADTPFYVHQVRTSPCGDSTAVELRDAQRRLRDALGVTVLSTTALDGMNGCHFAWLDGYQTLGDHNFATVARDLYGGPSAGVAAPEPVTAQLDTADPHRIVLTMRTPGDPLTVEAGAAADFRIDGQAVVTDVAALPGVGLELTLDQPAAHGAVVSYLGHLNAGPAVTTALGIGLLAFTGIDVT